jgi:NDP-sugar pyrophosphorylase family protein
LKKFQLLDPFHSQGPLTNFNLLKKKYALQHLLIFLLVMQIVIPLSGSGQRFADAGYKLPKPLITVHGKPIIEWVVAMYPGEHDFIFIAREDHLAETELETVLRRLAPYGRVLGIAPHKKGPAHAVVQAAELIDKKQPVVVSYCDFFMNWNYENFKASCRDEGWSGSIPCYTGFHPHLLHEKNVYAGCRVETVETKIQKRLLEIKEKFSFEQDKSKGWHSAGNYHFQSGEVLLHYANELIKSNQSLNGEFYMSLVYPLMLADGLHIGVYDHIPHFCQWGTPSDLQEYEWWAETFSQLQSTAQP